MQSLIISPHKHWTCVQTDRSKPNINISSLPGVLIRNNIERPDDFLSTSLIEQLQLWQHEAQFVRWCRLIKNFQEIGEPFQVLVKKQYFRLIGNGYDLRYRAHKGWRIVPNHNDQFFPKFNRVGQYYILRKRNRLILFSEMLGESFTHKII